MTNTLTVKGIPPYDGTYEFDLDGFTNRELHRIKNATGLRAGELEDAFASQDNDVLIALAIVVLERHGNKVVDDLLWDAPAGSALLIDLKPETEAEEGPPADALDPQLAVPGLSASNADSETPSGLSSNGALESPASDQSPTGAHV